jgi:hypothetical protein
MGEVQVAQAAAALTARAEARRVSALRTLSSGQQASLGQFFTPERAAALIADLPRLPETGQFRYLILVRAQAHSQLLWLPECFGSVRCWSWRS